MALHGRCVVVLTDPKRTDRSEQRSVAQSIPVPPWLWMVGAPMCLRTQSAPTARSSGRWHSRFLCHHGSGWSVLGCACGPEAHRPLRAAVGGTVDSRATDHGSAWSVLRCARGSKAHRPLGAAVGGTPRKAWSVSPSSIGGRMAPTRWALALSAVTRQFVCSSFQTGLWTDSRTLWRRSAVAWGVLMPVPAITRWAHTGSKLSRMSSGMM